MALALAYSAPSTPVEQRWRVEFTTPYGASYWAEVDAPTAAQALGAALHHGNGRPGFEAMFFASQITINQITTVN